MLVGVIRMQKVREFTYQKLTPEEQKERGILGRLVGTIADYKNETRNGRLYTEELWDNVFKNPIMQEKLATKTVFGELGHPADREEIDMEKIAISLAEEPKKCTDGTLKGVFDILDTPNGRILKTLCDYGCKIGVSSRGTGDVVEDWNGKPKVDPTTYNCECWDAVLLPSVKSARPDYVNESLSNNSGLRVALNEDLNRASKDDRRVMEDALKRLNLVPTKSLKEAITDNKSDSNKAGNIAADDVGASVVKSLQESLKKNKELNAQVRALKEQLSVCNAKEADLVKALQESKRFKSHADKLNEKLDSLLDQLEQKDEELSQLEEELERMTSKYNQLRKQRSLNESLKADTDKEIKRLNEQLREVKVSSEKEVNSLRESLEEVKQDSIIKERDLTNKLTRSNKLAEHYKKVANTAVTKYINSKAEMLGIEPSTIRENLKEGYSFKDIDKACEDLSKFRLKLDSLPFNLKQNKKNVKAVVKESYEPIKPKSGYDDEVDPQLVFLASK